MRELTVLQFHSSAVKDRNKPFSENSIQTSFYYEARRLWDVEEGRDSLTKVQAGMILCMCLSLAADVKLDVELHHFTTNAYSKYFRLGACEVWSRQRRTKIPARGLRNRPEPWAIRLRVTTQQHGANTYLGRPMEESQSSNSVGSE